MEKLKTIDLDATGKFLMTSFVHSFDGKTLTAKEQVTTLPNSRSWNCYEMAFKDKGKVRMAFRPNFLMFILPDNTIITLLDGEWFFSTWEGAATLLKIPLPNFNNEVEFG